MPTLDWLTRREDEQTAGKAPYRLLEPVAELSAGDATAENMVIHGDNLHALKALLPFYAGRVKCIYIDPPYNTRSAFAHYDDNLEHSQWLAMIYPRLELLRDLLSEDGSIWASIDDNEGHYLKVVMDEVFGRGNFIAEVIWQKRTSRENRAAIGSAHDTIFVYGKVEAKAWKDHRNLLPSGEGGFANPDNDLRGPWRSIPFSAQGYRPNQMYKIKTPSGKMVEPPKGRCWAATEPVFLSYLEQALVYFPNNGAGRPRIKQFAGEEKGLAPMSLWLASEVGDTEESKKEILSLFPSMEPFGTPKPERLIKQVIHIATNPGDLVLDSFLGSGTTAAVAHKMGRRYIGIELGEHAVTHCVPRLRKVIDGEQGGISQAVGWQGGGGFRFYRLGEPVFDEQGRINPAIRFEHLAAHVWFAETRTPLDLTGFANLSGLVSGLASPLLGIHGGVATYLLYNGILGDRRPAGGNVLTRKVLAGLPPFDGPKVIYGESCRLSGETLAAARVTFKQIPYDLKAR
jgi:adenine-specific DNA-methyltransferase